MKISKPGFDAVQERLADVAMTSVKRRALPNLRYPAR